jgi:hypothetical protein
LANPDEKGVLPTFPEHEIGDRAVGDDPMRTGDEIQRAHDILTAMILQREIVARLDDETRRVVTRSIDVLCWVLRHDHNESFQGMLEVIDAHMAAMGLELHRYPEMQYPNKGGKRQ